MTVTHDGRQRELVKCAGCGRTDRVWHRIVLSSDAAVVFDVQLCRRCESDTLGAVKRVWEAMGTLATR